MEPATRWFDWSFAPIPTSDERFARQYRCKLPPEFPLASPCACIVHHLSGPNGCALARFPHSPSHPVKGRRGIRDRPVVLRSKKRPKPPKSASHPEVELLSLRALVSEDQNTRTHVRLLGPCSKTGRLRLFSMHQRPERAVWKNLTPSSRETERRQERAVPRDAAHLGGLTPRNARHPQSPARPCAPPRSRK